MLESFRRILVTTDFSERGDHAIEHAFRIAADQGSEVVLAHVLEFASEPNPLYAHYSPTEVLHEAREKALAHARDELEKRVPRSERYSAVRHSVVIGEGSPASEIVRLAGERDVQLIVIATHGHTGLRHLVLGSVAEKVIRTAQCPVLVVR